MRWPIPVPSEAPHCRFQRLTRLSPTHLPHLANDRSPNQAHSQRAEQDPSAQPPIRPPQGQSIELDMSIFDHSVVHCSGLQDWPPAEISDSHGANLAHQNPAAPLVHDASSLLLPSMRPPCSLIREPSPPPMPAGSCRTASRGLARSAGSARSRYVLSRISMSVLLRSCACSDRPWLREGPSLPHPALTSHRFCCISPRRAQC